jgi:hypothetical protein
MTQKDFNRKMREYIHAYVPYEDQHLGMTELGEKYPEKVAEIKGNFSILIRDANQKVFF